ncbi:MAG: ATP-dependent DNA helicase RecG [Planctomycetota bacterium]
MSSPGPPSAEPPSPAQQLATPLAELPGVSPQRAALLSKLGLNYVVDALFNFPRGYEDFSDLRLVSELEADLPQTVRGVVTDVESSGGFGKNRVGVVIKDDAGGFLRATWFNQLFMRDKFKPGQRVQFSGKPKDKGRRWEMSHPRVAWIDGEDSPYDEGLLPLYALTEGLSQFHVRRIMADVVDRYVDVPEEVFPDRLLAAHGLMRLREALPTIHQPQDRGLLDEARRRFVFQELFVLQLALAARRHQQRVGFKAPELMADAKVDARIKRLFPFELTTGQRAAIDQVANDMGLDTPMNRLLQGDVGSGKTVVAVYAMLLCVAGGCQAALMAPTEVLARQHAQTLDALLRESRVEYRLLVGGQRDAERREVLAGLGSGAVDLVIGTHAILSDGVAFAKLGLAVIDEQHKFGVKQRAALRRGDHSPHYLVMTATPIPRTMSMTQFGDLDVSILRDMPPGRQPVETYLVESDQRDRWWNFVRDKLDEGRQAFVVTPLVDESEVVDATSVNQAFEQLAGGELDDYRVGLLHGRMPAAEKQQAMDAFRRGESQVLVSTTVIEVGVDVPNASVMVVASPERFGLSQLHQLRGRVGRGGHAGFCAVLAEAELSEAARQRLEAFAKTNDGFELAEIDFALRGPGDLFGARQSGLPPLRIADLVRDREVLDEARDAARAMFDADPGLKSPHHARLRRQMRRRYGAVLEISDVG